MEEQQESKKSTVPVLDSYDYVKQAAIFKSLAAILIRDSYNNFSCINFRKRPLSLAFCCLYIPCYGLGLVVFYEDYFYSILIYRRKCS